MQVIKSTPYYELHITYVGPEQVVDGWSNSAIHGDIDLGDGTRRYLTKHCEQDWCSLSIEGVIQELETTAAMLVATGVNVRRVKVEKVVYDRRVTV